MPRPIPRGPLLPCLCLGANNDFWAGVCWLRQAIYALAGHGLPEAPVNATHLGPVDLPLFVSSFFFVG